MKLLVSLVVLAILWPDAEAGNDDITTSYHRLNLYYPLAPLPDAVTGWQNARSLINNFTVILYSSDSRVQCFSFTAPGDPEHCDGWQQTPGLIRETTILAFDEVITNVDIWYRDGYYGPVNIKKIRVITNKQTINKGQANPGGYPFATTGWGGQLLFVGSGPRSDGRTFTEFKYSRSFIQEIATDKSYEIARDVMTAFKTDISIMDEVKARYYDSFYPAWSTMGCKIKGATNDNAYTDACVMSHLLQQLGIFANKKRQLMTHQPRSLMRIADFDSQVLLTQAQGASQYHNLLSNIQLGTQQTISNGAGLGRYFQTLAEYDRNIYTADKDFVSSELGRLKEGAEAVVADISHRLSLALKMAVGLTVGALAEAAAKLAGALAAHCNPFKVIFGGFDMDRILDRMQEVAEAARNVAKAAVLMANLNSYITHMTNIKQKLAQNEPQYARIRVAVERFELSSDSEQLELARDVIAAYGSYTPAVNMQELTYAVALLEMVAEEGCNLISDATGVWTNAAGGIYEVSQQDCLYLPPLIAQLNEYYEEMYSFQFDLVDLFAAIVRSGIAYNLASEITAINENVDVYDVRMAAIGSAIVELNLQAVAHQRCNEWEYKYGGMRLSQCRYVYMPDSMIQSAIAYDRPPASSIAQDKWGYIPMVQHGDSPYINMSQLLEKRRIQFQLPFDDIDWLIRYGWLPGDYRQITEETSYFIQTIEMYVPGMKCRGMDSYWFIFEVTTSRPVRLFVEDAPPKYNVPSKFYKFEYGILGPNEQCGNQETFNVRQDGDTMRHQPGSSICIRSRGTIDSEIIPSIYSTWNIGLRMPPNCQVEFEDLGYQPLISVRLDVKEIVEANLPGNNIDECWPDNSRCANCNDGHLSYTCPAGQT